MVYTLSNFYILVGQQITQSQVTTSAGSGSGATTITSSSQLAHAQQQLSPTGQQFVRLQNMVQSPNSIQTIQGIPGVTAAATIPGIQGTPPAANQPQQIITLPGGQQMAVRPATAIAAPQMIQLPQPQMVQQMMQMQVPVSQNGQTVLQTVQVPVQTMATPAPAPTVAQIPQIIQTSSGQQIVMQQVQIAQPQQQIQATPQFAQIITPTGQIQQVQVLGGLGNMVQAGGGQVIGGIQGIGGIQAMSIQQQLATVPPTTPQSIQVNTAEANHSSVPANSSAVSSSTSGTGAANNQSQLLTPKSEPQDQPADAADSKPVATKTPQQVVLQQQLAAGAVAVQQAQVVAVRAANGQIVQVKLN